MAALPAWEDRIKTIGTGLLTLEISTIEKPNMAASKMPEVPLALHEIAQTYADDLAKRRVFITDALLAAAQARIAAGDDPAKRIALENWPFDPGDPATSELTNGPRTFEALQWAAIYALKQLDSIPRPSASTSDEALIAVDIDRTLLSRISTNSRELRQVGLLLIQQLAAVPDVAKLLDGTREQTLGVLFTHPRPLLDIDVDVVLLIRKTWDIGLERVLFQTTMQVDGDVVMRVASDVEPVKREFYNALHRTTVETGIRQWLTLFELAKALATGIGQALFAPR